GLVVVCIGRAVYRGEAMAGGDPSEKGPQIGDPKVARRVEKEHRIDAIQRLGCKHAPDIIRGSAERRIEGAGPESKLLDDQLADVDRAVPESGCVADDEQMCSGRRSRGGRWRGGGRR